MSNQQYEERRVAELSITEVLPSGKTGHLPFYALPKIIAQISDELNVSGNILLTDANRIVVNVSINGKKRQYRISLHDLVNIVVQHARNDEKRKKR